MEGSNPYPHFDTFGPDGSGTAIIDWERPSLGYDVKVLGDGKVLVGGTVGAASVQNPPCLGVARLTEKGLPDDTFGSAGRAESPACGPTTSAGSLAVQPDGKILLGGSVRLNGDSRESFVVVRYHPDGSIDSGYGDNGIAHTVPPALAGHLGQAIALQPADRTGMVVKVVVAGYRGAVRFNPDGTLDTDFGEQGHAYDATHAVSANAIALQKDRAVVIVGYRREGAGPLSTGQPHAAIQRLDANGRLDTSFGDGGSVVVPFSSEPATTYSSDLTGVTIDPEGRIVAAGFEERESPGHRYRMGLVVCLTPKGDFDRSFGTVIPDVTEGGAGKLLINLANRRGDLADIALMRFSDGSSRPGRQAFVAVGDEAPLSGTLNNLALVALDEGGALISGFGNGGRWLAPPTQSLKGPRAIVVHEERAKDGQSVAKAVVPGFGGSGQARMAATRLVLSAAVPARS